MTSRLVLALLALSLALTACATPQPTPDAAATQEALAAAVESTLTAMAPSVEPTPLPSATPTATPEALPAVIPDDWVLYRSTSRTFTFYHPATWKLENEAGDAVSFSVPENIGSAFVMGAEPASKYGGAYGAERDDEALLENLASNIASSYKPEEKFRITVKQTLANGSGYQVEGTYVGTGIAEGLPAYRAWVLVVLPQDRVAICSYFRAGERRIPPDEREVFSAVVASLRVGADPAPRATPGPGPRPTADPVIEIAEFKAVAGDLLSMGMGSDALVRQQLEALQAGESYDTGELASRAQFAAEQWSDAEAGFLGFETSNAELLALSEDFRLYAMYRAEAYGLLAGWVADGEELDTDRFLERMALSDQYMEAAEAKLEALPGDR
jgi:hypothetical protein